MDLRTSEDETLVMATIIPAEFVNGVKLEADDDLWHHTGPARQFDVPPEGVAILRRLRQRKARVLVLGSGGAEGT